MCSPALIPIWAIRWNLDCSASLVTNPPAVSPHRRLRPKLEPPLAEPQELNMESLSYILILFLALSTLFFAIAFRDPPKIGK